MESFETLKKRYDLKSEIAELQEKIRKTQLRALQQNAEENPILENINSHLDKARDLKKSTYVPLGNGSNSVNVRRRKHELWIEEINAYENLQNAISELSEAQVNGYNDILTSASEMIVNGSSDEEVIAFIDRSLLELDFEELQNNVNALELVYSNAQETRKEYSKNN